MKTTNKQTNREDLEALIRITTDRIQSTAIDAKLAFEKYDQIPSIPNGARRHETAQKLQKEIIRARTFLWNTWEKEYRQFVPVHEFIQMMDDELTKQVSTDNGRFWIGAVGRELNGKDGE